LSFLQVAGAPLRMRASDFNDALAREGPLADVVRRYAQGF
jgi:hypothetical protein